MDSNNTWNVALIAGLETAGSYLLPPAPQLNLRVLVADDNLLNQLAVGDIFERLGWQVDVMNDCLEAAEACMRADYDLILMNCAESEGLAAIRLIREREKLTGKHIPLVAVGAEGLGAGKFTEELDGRLAGPITLDALVDSIDPWMLLLQIAEPAERYSENGRT